MRIKFVTAAFAAAAAVSGASAQDTAYLDGFDEWVESARAAWSMPGLSVAIVDGDAVVFAHGFGTLEQGGSTPVDADTLFAIGSNTKQFTAAAVGALVDEGKLGWNDKVVERLDGFILSDPYRTGEIEIRDTLSHRAGYATWAGDLLWWGSDISREESVGKLKHLEPAYALRTEWGYSNFMFLVAGEIIEQASGQDWDTVIETRILEPLGMERSFSRFSEVENARNVATPHSMVDGEHVMIPHRDISNIAPAGAIYSSANDMAKWLLMRVHDGAYGGEQVVSEATINMLRRPHTVLPGGHREGNPIVNGVYGLGVMTASYRGEYLTRHGGGIDGMISQVAALPDKDFGVVVLTNSDEWGGLADAVVYEAIDRFLGVDNRSWSFAGDETAADWSEFGLARTLAGRAATAEAEGAAEAERLTDSTPSLPLEAYVGTYRDDFMGDVEVTLNRGALSLNMTRHAELQGPLAHWQLDTFQVDWDAPAARESLVEFDIGTDAKVKSLSFQVRPDFLDPLVYEFEKVAEEEE